LAAEPRTTEDRPPKLGESVQDLSQHVSQLVREEIELAQAELQAKAKRLARGAAFGIVAGTFALVALLFLVHGVAWLFAQELFNPHVWLGYFLTAVLLLLLGALLGFLAYRLVSKAMPAKPELAIEEAKRIQQTVKDARS
jgi:uncharacterized membrane protein YqjE